MGIEDLNDDPVYVAVSEDVAESRSTLLWALRTLRVKKLHLVYVHQLISMTPSSSGLKQSKIDTIEELELTSINESLFKYHDICIDEGVTEQDVDMSYFSAINVGEWIVELIYQNNIKKLIMGVTADSCYSEGMVHITSTKAEYVIRHPPHCCKIWLVCNGNLIQTREGRFELAGSSYSYSESSTSVHSLDSALIPYGGAGRAERVTEPYALSSSEPHPLSSSEERSATGFETMYYKEQRRRLKIEELKREKKQRDKMRCEREEPLSNSFGVTQILYNEEVIRRREAEAELNRVKAEIEDMKRVQKEHEVQHYTDCRLLEMIQKELDEAIKTSEERLIQLNLEKAVSSSHSPSSPSQWSVSDEPPQCFLCPISKEIMHNPHVAADGYTYEADEFRKWLRHGGETSPMTNLRLENFYLTPNLTLHSAIREWLQRHPHFYDSS